MGTKIIKDENKEGYRKGITYEITSENPIPFEIAFLNHYEKTGFLIPPIISEKRNL